MFCSRFFFQLRVKDKDGNDIVPKKNTLAAYKSAIRTEVKERHKLDIFDSCLFPEHLKLWRSVEKMLVSEGRSETRHHDEVEPTPMRKIYHLLSLVEDLINEAHARPLEEFLKYEESRKIFSDAFSRYLI